MKKTILSVFIYLCGTSLLQAQVPQAFNYQAVVRDDKGNAVKNKAITVKASISFNDTLWQHIVWQETHSTQSNEFGLFTIQIGKGTSTGAGSLAAFDSILWGAFPYYLGIEVDFGSGMEYMGSSQLLSVPYALYSLNSATSNAQVLSLDGHNLSISGGNTIVLPDEVNDADADPLNEIQTLALNGKTLSISSGNSITLPADNDADSLNEIQSLSLNGNTLSLSKANNVNLPLTWNKKGNDLNFTTGAVSIGTTFNYSDSAKLNVSDSSRLNLPVLLYTYSKGSDNFFLTSKNILGIIQGSNGINQAICGLSTGISSTGTNEGLFGQANSSAKNYGVHGLAKAGTSGSYNYGVFGEASGTTNQFNSGVYGTAIGSSNYNRGIDGRTEGTGAHNEGVFGHSIGVTSGYNIGVYGFSQSSSVVNYGILGETKGTSSAGWHIALFGDASATTATTSYGLYARSVAATNKYAAYLDGNVTYTGTLNGPSDIKLKTDIQTMTGALDLIKKLNPVSYNFKQEYRNQGINFPQNQQYGFIAQEVEKVLPELVSTQIQPVFNDKGNGVYNAESIETLEYKGLNYIGLIPLLTKAIQEQQKIIEKQQEDILYLKSELEILKRKSTGQSE